MSGSEGTSENIGEATEQGHGPRFSPSNSAEQATHDDILRVLSDFQLGLESLKTLHAQRQALQQQLAAREHELMERDLQLSVQRGQFEQSAKTLAQEIERAREEQQHELVAVRQQAVEALARHQAELATLKSELQTNQENAAVQLQDFAAERDQARLAADRFSEQVASLTALTQRHQSESAAQRGEFDTQRAELERQRAEVTRQQSEYEQLRTFGDTQRNEIERLSTEISRQRDEMQRLRSTIEQHQAQAQAGKSAIDQGRAESEARRIEAARLESEVQRVEAELKEARHELENAANTGSVALARAARLMEERDDAQSRLGEYRGLVEEFEQLWGIESREEATPAERLNAAQGAHDRYEQQMLATRTALQEHEARRTEEEARLSGMTAKLAQAEAAARSLREAVHDARHAPAARGNEWTTRRKARLRTYRMILRQHVNKLRRGSEALAKRYEQCEQILSHRAELAAIRERVIDAERRSQRARAGSRAVAITFFATLTVAILGALSWAISREMAPAVFMAHATIKADGRGRDLNEAELDEWRRFHTELLTDPRFHEDAAERFARQGIPSLGTPASVAHLVQESLTTDTPAPDELRLDLRGEGHDKVRRTLECFTSSLASFANAAQQRRIDGGATVVPAPASADSDPIDNTQTYYALGMLGIGVTIATILAISLWRRLANVKTAFEQEGQVALALDEARWGEVLKKKGV